MLNGNELCATSQDADFPDNYVDQCHPEDYIQKTTSEIELIYRIRPYHNRIFLRVCILIDSGVFVPMTFVCDTGAPGYLYICERARKLIKNRIRVDDRETEFLSLDSGKNMVVSSSPSNHSNSNIMGLRALSFFGLFLENDTFGFNNLPE